MKRDADTTKLENLPSDEDARREAFLTFLGQELMAFRHNALRWALGRVSPNALEGMPSVDRKYYERLNKLSADDYETCQQVCEKMLGEFMQQFLTLITSHPQNWPLGSQHGLNYKLLVEVINLPKSKSRAEPRKDTFGDDEIDDFVPPDRYVDEECPDYGETLETLNLSSGVSLHLPNYWYRWLNRYGRESPQKSNQCELPAS